MDPDSGGYCTSSAFLKTSVLTITFTSFYFYETDNPPIFLRPPAIQRDTVTVVGVKEKALPARKKKTIYLTFDDGPNKGTRNVMHIIHSEQVPATLFVIGEHVYGSRGQTAIFDSLSTDTLLEIANHSYTHAFSNRYDKFYAQPDSVVKDFKRCADSLGIVSHIIRTPGRNIWRLAHISSTDLKSSAAAADSLQKNGYKLLGWDLEWHFDQQQHIVQTPEELLCQVDSLFAHNKTKTTGHLVLLAHDQVYHSPADSTALQQFIYQLKKSEEFNFETVRKYPGINN
jgi:peptidoglycan/xylan/chitin deacetylase (PgdA/CDA1 family)